MTSAERIAIMAKEANAISREIHRARGMGAIDPSTFRSVMARVNTIKQCAKDAATEPARADLVRDVVAGLRNI